MANPPETAELNVSVVICTYERPDALARCLDHLKRQSTAPLEVVVVDASFIGLGKLLPAVVRCLADGGELVALVKPQLEVGRDVA